MTIHGWRGVLAGLLFALASALPMRAESADAARAAHLQRQIEVALQEEAMAGAVWATVESDGAITTGAAGLKHVVSGDALARDSKVHVGSLTKSVIGHKSRPTHCAF